MEAAMVEHDLSYNKLLLVAVAGRVMTIDDLADPRKCLFWIPSMTAPAEAGRLLRVVNALVYLTTLDGILTPAAMQDGLLTASRLTPDQFPSAAAIKSHFAARFPASLQQLWNRALSLARETAPRCPAWFIPLVERFAQCLLHKAPIRIVSKGHLPVVSHNHTSRLLEGLMVNDLVGSVIVKWVRRLLCMRSDSASSDRSAAPRHSQLTSNVAVFYDGQTHGHLGPGGRLHVGAGVRKFALPPDITAVGFKAVKREGGCAVAALLIPASAETNIEPSPPYNKFRASKVEVVVILPLLNGGLVDEPMATASSMYDRSYVYRAGHTHRPVNGFDRRRDVQCGPGLHFILSAEGAIAYAVRRFESTSRVPSNVEAIHRRVDAYLAARAAAARAKAGVVESGGAPAAEEASEGLMTGQVARCIRRPQPLQRQSSEPSAPAVTTPGGRDSAVELSGRRDPASSGNCWPSEFECPITLKMMEDPVTGPDGVTYERAALQRWFDAQETVGDAPTLPTSRMLCRSHQLVPNLALKSLIEAWRLACELG